MKKKIVYLVFISLFLIKRWTKIISPLTLRCILNCLSKFFGSCSLVFNNAEIYTLTLYFVCFKSCWGARSRKVSLSCCFYLNFKLVFTRKTNIVNSLYHTISNKYFGSLSNFLTLYSPFRFFYNLNESLGAMRVQDRIHFTFLLQNSFKKI